MALDLGEKRIGVAITDPQQTMAFPERVLVPKVIGVELLDEASDALPLDFFILCSSLAAVVGNVGQADYAAANAYLNAC